VSVSWALSGRDWRFHAIEERGNHLNGGGYRTECGHLLIVTVLYDSPGGLICKDCAASQLADPLRDGVHHD
jgi:hypothetical protein